MSDPLAEMSVFSRIVSTGSLSGAARELGISPAVVSRRLSALEARLGVRLVNRTTRSLRLTDEGATYYENCTRLLSEIEEADAAVAAGRSEPRGPLRVALPAAFGHLHVAPLVPRFAARYPNVQLLISLSDRNVNVIDEGFDLAVRIAKLADSSLAARRLAPNHRVVCASPDYLRRHGTPRTPDELVAHNCLTTSDLTMTWEYTAPGGDQGSVRVTGRYACDNWEVLREWAIAGLGVALKSTWDIREPLRTGALVQLCPGYTFDTDVAIYAVYPHRRLLPAKTRAFIEFLADSFGPDSYWDHPTEPAPGTSGGRPKPRIKGRAAA
ncbi:MAG: LysR family transcriptional regulator [Betaproteobacteria bacterium]|nr:LysR family transcriptional regulator [Betaproteobacteria bacterium]